MGRFSCFWNITEVIDAWFLSGNEVLLDSDDHELAWSGGDTWGYYREKDSLWLLIMQLYQSPAYYTRQPHFLIIYWATHRATVTKKPLGMSTESCLRWQTCTIQWRRKEMAEVWWEEMAYTPETNMLLAQKTQRSQRNHVLGTREHSRWRNVRGIEVGSFRSS